MKNLSAIIIGGTGQYGILMGQLLLKKNYKVYITTRFNKKKKKFKKDFPKLKFLKLNIYDKQKIKNIFLKIKPKLIFYFAGQSSPQLSFKKKSETLKSNYLGCKNVLDLILENNLNSKFLNATSSEMYGHIFGKINLSSPKKPLNPYGKAKKKAFNLVKNYREKNKMKNYNAILFNTESFLRKKNFLIPKICLAAINANKYDKKTSLNNILVSREWNWCESQCELIYKFLKKKPQDFILSNGKSYSIKKMLTFAFEYFNLNYKNYIKVKNTTLNKNEVLYKKTNYKNCLRRNKIKANNKIFGKKLIYKMIKFYLNEK